MLEFYILCFKTSYRTQTCYCLFASRLVADKNIENNKDGRRLEKVMLSFRE